MALVFVVSPRRSGAGQSGWVHPRSGPPLEQVASAALVVGWSGQLAALALPDRVTKGRRRMASAGTLYVSSLALALAAQAALGPAWRTSVAGTGRTPLVTAGPYRLIRHPVYTAMLGMLAGNWLMDRHWATAVGGLLAAAGLELQARAAEEPALAAAYADDYPRWAAVTGRFVPRLRPCRGARRS